MLLCSLCPLRLMINERAINQKSTSDSSTKHLRSLIRISITPPALTKEFMSSGK